MKIYSFYDGASMFRLSCGHQELLRPDDSSSASEDVMHLMRRKILSTAIDRYFSDGTDDVEDSETALQCQLNLLISSGRLSKMLQLRREGVYIVQKSAPEGIAWVLISIAERGA